MSIVHTNIILSPSPLENALSVSVRLVFLSIFLLGVSSIFYGLFGLVKLTIQHQDPGAYKRVLQRGGKLLGITVIVMLVIAFIEQLVFNRMICFGITCSVVLY